MIGHPFWFEAQIELIIQEYNNALRWIEYFYYQRISVVLYIIYINISQFSTMKFRVNYKHKLFQISQLSKISFLIDSKNHGWFRMFGFVRWMFHITSCFRTEDSDSSSLFVLVLSLFSGAKRGFFIYAFNFLYIIIINVNTIISYLQSFIVILNS